MLKANNGNIWMCAVDLMFPVSYFFFKKNNTHKINLHD